MVPSTFRDELTRRMALPQRHRLLQGYPMMPLHRLATEGMRDVRRLDGELRGPKLGRGTVPPREPAWIRLDPSRPLIVGVLPHTQCNPKVAGCGFCTFPHDRYDKPTLIGTVDRVGDEIRHVVANYPELASRRVDAVYFGGATANLTPRKQLAALGETLAANLNLREAEVTLEGVPSLFRSLLGGPFEALLEFPARHRRLSMGVQTFHPEWLARMGRQAFGDRRTVSAVIDRARRAGMTTSGDFLINLPGQSRQAMLDDVRSAAEVGFDQICVYHLVLTEGTGAAWAKDESLLASLPDTATAKENGARVRDWLFEHGFVQTTLTNFERAEVHATERRFRYEEHSFSPDRYDAIGFGPTAISTFIDWSARRAVKYVRGKSVNEGRKKDDLFFPYEEEDLRLLFLTRTLARLRVERSTYRALFGADVTDQFPEALEASVNAGLLTVDDQQVRLTSDGVFFADSVVGLLAWPRTTQLRATAAGQHTRDVLDRRVVVDFMG